MTQSESNQSFSASEGRPPIAQGETLGKQALVNDVSPGRATVGPAHVGTVALPGLVLLTPDPFPGLSPWATDGCPSEAARNGNAIAYVNM